MIDVKIGEPAFEDVITHAQGNFCVMRTVFSSTATMSSMTSCSQLYPIGTCSRNFLKDASMSLARIFRPGFTPLSWKVASPIVTRSLEALVVDLLDVRRQE